MKKRETPNTVSFNKRPQHHKRIGESGDEFYSSNDWWWWKRDDERFSNELKRKRKRTHLNRPPFWTDDDVLRYSSRVLLLFTVGGLRRRFAVYNWLFDGGAPLSADLNEFFSLFFILHFSVTFISLSLPTNAHARRRQHLVVYVVYVIVVVSHIFDNFFPSGEQQKKKIIIIIIVFDCKEKSFIHE